MAEMKLLVPVLRALAAGTSHSAEAIARRVGGTREQVVSVLAEAREYGVPIEARRGRGYVLSHAIDWLDAGHVFAAMGAVAVGLDLRILDRVDSTNDAVLRVADAREGRVLVVTAELQDGGRGRRGRRWNSGVANGLTFTMLWQVRKRRTSISAVGLVVGVGLWRALAHLGGGAARLKWPNDLLCAHGKLGGVLIESVVERGPGTIVIGVGLNVRLPAQLRATIDQPVADLETVGVKADRSTILGACLSHLYEALMQFEQEGFARLREEWLAHAAYLGEGVTLRHSHGSVEEGTFAGIDEDGALLLSTSLGSKKIYSGDVSLRAADAGHQRSPS